MDHPKRATISEIAARAGVSKGAVSFALNGRPGVSEETRGRVLAIAEELNWKPNRAARALGQSRAGAVGFVLNRSARILGTETFFPQLLSGIQLGLTGSHTALHMMVVGSVEEELNAYREWWQSRIVDGVIMVDPRVDDPRLEVLEHLGLPAVQVGSHPSQSPTIPSVWVDDRAATRTLVAYLHGLGHRRIAHIAGPQELEHTHLRRQEFAAAVQELGLTSSSSVSSGYEADDAVRATRELLSLAEPPTALLYDTDVMAVASLREAQGHGLRVPEDLSIVSFEDSLLVRLGNPPVTSLTRDTVAFGTLAVKTLLAHLDADLPVPSAEGAEPTLSIRESSGPAPTN
ncbi:LacI family DNA-binding transcriptional regulator [Arthrobacter sp. NPDC090010]|uniref:LacI family DNA-binding transcriptional regulator n=1 Tax=Arthrobacter sp. NPDC090010 TaxID=3363942 RepID=UPI0037F894B9